MIITKYTASPNYNDRKADQVDMLILHYTDTIDLNESLGILTDPDREVSAHYLVDMNGDIIQMVDEGHRAWHAGQSYWRGITDVNSHSIGIEIQNPGHSHGYQSFPEEQMDAVLVLCQDILGRHKIPKHNILAHSDIAPARKQDPGELFDWAFLAQNDIGVWPQPVANSDSEHRDHEQTIDQLLIDYGYDPNVTADQRLTAFKRHFGWQDDPEVLHQKAVFLSSSR